MLKKLKVNQGYIQRNNLHCKWDKLFKNGARKFFGRKPLKKLKGYDLLD